MSPARSVSTLSKNERPPSGGRFGVEPITMSPVAAIVTTPAGVVRGVVLTTVVVVVLTGSGFDAAFAFSADRGRRPVDEQREDERDRDEHGTRAEDKCERPHGRPLAAGGDEVDELRQGDEGGRDVGQRCGAEHLARAAPPHRR